MAKNLEIVVGIPAYNEEKNIAKVILSLQKFTNKIIVCNDGSTDLTGEIAKRMGAIVIDQKRNLGYGSAIRNIFLKARELDFDVLVTFDADGQHRVKDITTVIEPILKNEADLVIGSRFLTNDNDTVPAYRKLGIQTITKIANTSTSSKIKDSQSGFRAYNKRVVDEILPSEHGMSVSTEILIKASKKEFKITEVPIKVLYEGQSSTHNAASHGVSVLLGTMKFISIEHPLSFYGIPGLIFLAIGLFFTAWTILAFTETRQIITNISMIGIGTTIIGVVFIMTAIMLYTLVNVVRERQSR